MSRVVRAASSFWLRLLITTGLLLLVGLQVDWSAATDALTEGQWAWFATAIVVLIGSLVLGALRWHVFLQAAGIGKTWVETLRAYGIGAFSNTILPTSFGGDAARAWIIGHREAQVGRALVTVVADRLSALACLLALGLVAAAADSASVPSSLAIALIVACSGATAGAGSLVLFRAQIGKIVRRLPGRMGAALRDAGDVLGSYLRNGRLLQTTLLMGFAYQFLLVWSVWLLARTIDLKLSFALVAVTVPLVLLATMMPISIGGFGVREAGFVVLLGEAGVNATDATLLSLLSAAALALASLPGAVAFLVPIRRAERPRAQIR
jgi:glycosyltransferase 2 family protein